MYNFPKSITVMWIANSFDQVLNSSHCVHFIRRWPLHHERHLLNLCIYNLHVCVCVFIIYIYIYIYIYVLSWHIYICVCGGMCFDVIYAYIHMWVCIPLHYIYICVCVCVCVCGFEIHCKCEKPCFSIYLFVSLPFPAMPFSVCKRERGGR